MRLPHAPTAMLVSGSALFDKGIYRLDSYWNLDRGGTDLYLLEFERSGQQIWIPDLPVSPHLRNLGDPLAPGARGGLDKLKPVASPLRRLFAV